MQGGILTFAGGVAAAVALWLAVASRDGPAPLPSVSAAPPAGASEAGADGAELGRLVQRLERESAERAALAERVARLEAALGSEPSLARRGEEQPDPASGADAAAGGPVTAEEPAPGPPSEEALVAAGFSHAEVRAYRERIDELQLQRLYLRDRAAREGWLGTPRFAEESAALSRSLLGTREEFGEDLYDWTLFAGGHPNRVRITKVMEGSPAAQAGLEAGDLVVGYGEGRVFSPSELREATTRGDAGSSTEVQLERGGERLRLFVPRGPLGVHIEAVSREPRPAG